MLHIKTSQGKTSGSIFSSKIYEICGLHVLLEDLTALDWAESDYKINEVCLINQPKRGVLSGNSARLKQVPILYNEETHRK